MMSKNRNPAQTIPRSIHNALHSDYIDDDNSDTYHNEILSNESYDDDRLRYEEVLMDEFNKEIERRFALKNQT